MARIITEDEYLRWLEEPATEPENPNWDELGRREAVRVKRRMAAYAMACRKNEHPTNADVNEAASLLNKIRRMALSNYHLDEIECEANQEYVKRKSDQNYRLQCRYEKELEPYNLTIHREWSIENVYEPMANGGIRKVWPIGLHFFD